MIEYKTIDILPMDIQQDWGASLTKATPTEKGCFRLVGIKRTEGRGFQGQRITVLVVDENGFPLPNVPVAFSYSTADRYVLTPDFLWTPPQPHRAFITPTQGSGMADQIQGDTVKNGGPGGVTVYALEAEYSCDIVEGAGMLADHTGLFVTFQLQRVGYRSLYEMIANFEQRLAVLEAGRE